MLKPLAVLGIAVTLGPLSLALTNPPGDEAVIAAIRAFEQTIHGHKSKGELSREDFDALRSAALAGLDVGSMRPHQIALVYAKGLLFVDDRRERALTRLGELAPLNSTEGAAAAVLRLELLGNPFLGSYKGNRFVHKPDPAVQETLMAAALTHPHLSESVARHDAAAARVLSAVCGTGRGDLWRKRRIQFVALADLFERDAPLQFVRDASDYVKALEAVVEDEPERDQHRAKIVRGSLSIVRTSFSDEASAIDFAAAEPCLQAIREIASEQERAAVDAVHDLIVSRAAAAMKRPDNGLSPAEQRDLEQVIERMSSDAARGRLVGREAPNLEFTWSSRRGLHSLMDLRGRVVVLDFWATNCVPCVASFPALRNLQNLYRECPVEIVGVTSPQGFAVGSEGRIDCRDDPAKEMSLMPDYIQRKEITWTIAFTAESVYNPRYAISGIPHMVIIDPKGIVRRAGRPPDDMNITVGWINEILQENALHLPIEGRDAK